MKLLIIGGSNFVGYHVSDAALQRGHKITLFNRGKSNPDVFPQAEHLTGDRDGDLAPLMGRQWDAVIDTCGYVPRIVRKSADMLKGAVGHYHFVSTVSVYPESEYGAAYLDENSPLATIDDPTTEAITGESYGALKVLCENVVQELYPGKFSVSRPGLIVGPRDHTDRFTYWPKRVAQGGAVLAPGHPDGPFQVIDGRDLANFILTLVENSTSGIFNAVGPGEPTTWGSMLATCQAVTGSNAELVWVGEEFLLENNVAPWMDMPLWLPAALSGMSRTRYDRAAAAGLTHRPLADTVRDLLAWDATRPPADPNKRNPNAPTPLAPEREAELIAAWREKINA